MLALHVALPIASEGVEHEGRGKGDDAEPCRLRSPRERNQRGHRQEGPEGGVIVEEQSKVELDVVLVLCAPKGGRSIHLEQLGEHSGDRKSTRLNSSH